MERFKSLFEPNTFLQISWSFLVACFAQLGTAAAVCALFVVLYQLKINYYKAKLTKAQYEKFCEGLKENYWKP